MSYRVRRMKMSEHTQESWEALFEAGEDKPNYCVVSPAGKVLDSCLTLEQARDEATYYQEQDEYYVLELDELMEESCG